MNRRKLPLGFARSVRVFYSDEALFFFRYVFLLLHFSHCAARKTTDDLLDDGRCENNYDDDIIIVGVGCESADL